MHTVSLKTTWGFPFLWKGGLLPAHSSVVVCHVLPGPLVSSQLQYTSLTSFLVCATQHVLPTTSSSFCYFFMVSSDFGGHWTWNLLPSACWDCTHSPRRDYPIVFLKTNLREERELIVPLGFVSGNNFKSNKGDEWFGGSCLLKTSVDLPSLRYIPELVPKDCWNTNG